ncbi:GNAT family N-acetyltransferase [Microbacterium sp. P06]|uniref:GNAT family N-acetyltransferase n=1 Tax=Microbacterium sp. P06 TaxID=3366949 RepID=UPI003744E231
MRALPETDRLVLRELGPSDLGALTAILSDAETMVAYEGPFDRTEVATWLARQERRYVEDGFGLWAVTLRETGELIGQCGPTRQVIEGESMVEVGYLFNRRWWHQGFAIEAARASRDWGFHNLPVDRVCSKVRDTNLPSMNVAIRNGMTPRRRIVTHYRGVDMPHLVFEITRDEWMLRSEPRRP